MTDAVASPVEATATETAAPVAPVAPVVADEDLSNEELMAKYATKDAPEEEAPAEAQDATKDAPAEEPAAVVEEAKPVEPSALERAIAKAGAWREKQAARTAQAKYEAESARVRAEADAARAEAATLKARLDAYKSPDRAKVLEAFERDGIPADAIAEYAVKSGSPEYKAEQELRALREDIAALKAERETSAKAQAEAAEKATKAQQEQAYDQARQNFVKQAADAAAYPTLARMANLRPMALVQHAEEVLQEASARTGETYTNAEILTYLESVYARELGLPNQSNGATKSTAAQAASPETKPGTSAPETNAAGKPRTLTNSMAEKGTVAKVALEELSEREQNDALAKMLLEGKLK